MKIENNPNFIRMCRQGIEGAFLGIIGGAILGIIIFYVQYPLAWLSFNPGMMDNGRYLFAWVSAAQPGTIGACVGAVIGGVFGCIQALKASPAKAKTVSSRKR